MIVQDKFNKLKQVFYSLSDQIFSMGAVFVINVVLARSSSEYEYGVFVIVYSFYTFITGLHNALILEPYTVFASGRYQKWFDSYLQFILKVNFYAALALSIFVLLVTGLVWVFIPSWYNSAMIGMAMGLVFLLSGSLFRRVFYIRQESIYSGLISFLYFVTVVVGITFLFLNKLLSGFNVFLLLSLGWLLVSPIFFKQYAFKKNCRAFKAGNSDYWAKHWYYSRWVFATALVFQLINQGYYWLTGAILNVEEVAKLRAVQNIIIPSSVFFIAISQLALPRMSEIFQNTGVNGVVLVLKKLILFLIFGAIIYLSLILLFGEKVLDLLYDGKYTAYNNLLYIIGITPIMYAIGNAYNDALKAMEQTKWVFKAYLGGGLFTLVGGIPLVYKFEILGAAWGILLSSVVYSIVLMYGFHGQKNLYLKSMRTQ